MLACNIHISQISVECESEKTDKVDQHLAKTTWPKVWCYFFDIQCWCLAQFIAHTAAVLPKQKKTKVAIWTRNSKYIICQQLNTISFRLNTIKSMTVTRTHLQKC